LIGATNQGVRYDQEAVHDDIGPCMLGRGSDHNDTMHAIRGIQGKKRTIEAEGRRSIDPQADGLDELLELLSRSDDIRDCMWHMEADWIRKSRSKKHCDTPNSAASSAYSSQC